MFSQMLQVARRSSTMAVAVVIAFTSAGCGSDDGLAGPDGSAPPASGNGAGTSAGSYSEGDIRPVGVVTQTADGYTVTGSLGLTVGGSDFTFVNANLRVQKDASGRVTNVSGRAQIPSPHERISFTDPVDADVGLFNGKWLNENRELGIRLKDDTDYFVYRVKTAFEMKVATGETGAGATKPIAIRAPFGGEVLFICDYRDPMYYVHGAQDLLGDAGAGWSLHGRLPFVPRYSVAGLGAFDGRTIRTGTFPIMKVLSVSGQLVDNSYLELHQSDSEPLSAPMRAGYQAGINGAMSLDLTLSAKRRKQEVAQLGLRIPIGDGSAGVWQDVSTVAGFQGHTYLKAVTTSDFSWWPSFIPAKPLSGLEVGGFIKSDGDHGIDLVGRYGWKFPSGEWTMTGSVHMSPEAMTLAGAIATGGTTLQISSTITDATTGVAIQPPQSILNAVSAAVNQEVGAQIDKAQDAWEDLQQATKDYEFELSLRGLRATIPAIVDGAKSYMSSTITSYLEPHDDMPYYGTLKSYVDGQAAPYIADLNALKAAALDTRDNAATRIAIETALRNLAARKFFTPSWSLVVFGKTIASVSFSVRVLSDAHAASLVTAANNVKYIPATSTVKIQMAQVYSQIPGKAIFEKVRDKIQNGLIVIPTLSEFGFVVRHVDGVLSVYAIFGGQRRTVATVDAFNVPAITSALAQAAIAELTR